MHIPANAVTPPSQTLDFAQFDTVLEAGRTVSGYWTDLWRYRQLFLVLAWRDVALRYKQTVAGVAWAVVQPAATMIVLTVIFGLVAGLPSEGEAPYAIMVLAGLLPWQFFANTLSYSSQSVNNNAAMISKIYFPRLMLPASTVLVSLVDFAIACGILLGLMAWYQFWPTWRLLALPALAVLAIIAALGPGLIVAALSARYRDFRFVVGFIVQFGLYASPVAYSSSVVRERFGETAFLLYSLNPMVAVIDAFRWAILGTRQDIHAIAFVCSLLVALAWMAVGLWYFRRTERVFADVI